MKTYEIVSPNICHPLGSMYANETNVVNVCQSVFFPIYQRHNAWFWKQKTRLSDCNTILNKIKLYIRLIANNTRLQTYSTDFRYVLLVRILVIRINKMKEAYIIY